MTGAICLAEMLGALSLTTDLGAGVPFEKRLRTAVVGQILADELDPPRDDRRAAYYAALLRSLGCTAHASTFAEAFDDDDALQRELSTRLAESVPAQGRSLTRGSCEVSAALGHQLQLPEGAIAALDQVYERFDGRGYPGGLAGDRLTVAARVVHVAEQAARPRLRRQQPGDRRRARGLAAHRPGPPRTGLRQDRAANPRRRGRLRDRERPRAGDRGALSAESCARSGEQAAPDLRITRRDG